MKGTREGLALLRKEITKILERIKLSLPENSENKFLMQMVLDAYERDSKLDRYIIVGLGLFLIAFIFGLAVGLLPWKYP